GLWIIPDALRLSGLRDRCTGPVIACARLRPMGRGAKAHAARDDGLTARQSPSRTSPLRITNHQSPITGARLARAEPRPASAIDPDAVAVPAPVAVLVAAGAGDLLDHGRAARAAVPVAGAAALVVAGAGDAVVAVLAPLARAAGCRAAGLGELAAAAVVHPQGVATLAPGAALDAGGLGQLLHQHGAAAEGAG